MSDNSGMNRLAMMVSALIAAALLGGCVTPYDIGNADPRVTPTEAAKNLPGMLNHTVAWGGLIAAAKNLQDKTELEVVAYPLDSANAPDNSAPPTGRFIVVKSGYLETADFAPGRLITVVGTVTETRTGTVGEAKFVYPVVVASKLQLWPQPKSNSREPNVHFGIGVGIIR
ncbi:MAG TPA: Slp family lipoprotein [Candidatus Methylomirabilis sp.]|nr:Slp family lipoprotein [Candidatus Methylomirabilis sp.]